MNSVINWSTYDITGSWHLIFVETFKCMSLRNTNLFIFIYLLIRPLERGAAVMRCLTHWIIFEPQQEDNSVHVVRLNQSRWWALHPRGSRATRLRIIAFYRRQGVNLLHCGFVECQWTRFQINFRKYQIWSENAHTSPKFGSYLTFFFNPRLKLLSGFITTH